jgi:hypothetical protein
MGVLMKTRSAAAAAAVWTLAACASGASDDPGADAYFRVPGAQFVRGAMPSPSSGAPGVASIVVVNSSIRPNLVDYPISGALDPGATAAAMGLQGDVGYWIVAAGLPNVATPDDPSYAATATFSAGIVAGEYRLLVEAVDGAGRFGAASAQTLTATAGAVTGALVFRLTWDTESDMDLHVVDPRGVEIYHDAMSDAPPPFAPAVDGGSYGYLNWDSNANCVIDGKREEDVVWPDAPPSGTYVARVDAASLCGEPIAHFTVEAWLAGQSVGKAVGVALDPNTQGPHGAGAGLTLLTVVVP